MKAKDYLSERLNVFGTYHHCYTCNSTWEHYHNEFCGVDNEIKLKWDRYTKELNIPNRWREDFQ